MERDELCVFLSLTRPPPALPLYCAGHVYVRIKQWKSRFFMFSEISSLRKEVRPGFHPDSIH